MVDFKRSVAEAVVESRFDAYGPGTLLVESRLPPTLVGELESRLYRVDEPLSYSVAQNQAVHDDIDRVLLVLVEPRDLPDLRDLPIDSDANEPRLLDPGESVLVLALLPAHDRRHHLDPRAGWM